MRARTKRLEDIDPELVCCEKLAQRFRDMAGMEIEVTEPIFAGRLRCQYCGHLHRKLSHATLVNDPFGHRRAGTIGVIAFAFIDLDEGSEEQFTEFREFVMLEDKCYEPE